MKNYPKNIALLSAFLLLVFIFPTALQAQISSFAELDYSYAVNHQQVTGGQQIAYIDEGEGPAIMLVHGLGSYIPAWKQNIPELSKSHRVIALDLPGYGKSSKKVKEYSISFFAQTVAELQDSLGIPKAIWAGHSMGGQIALEGALTHPQKITKLILLAPAGFETFTEQEGSMMSSFVTPTSIKTTSDSMIRQTFKATFHKFPPEAEFMAEDRVAIRNAEDFDGYAQAYAGSVQAMLKGPVFDQLSQIKHPALIIYGMQDALIPNKQLHANLTTQKVAESGHKNLPNSRLKMINEAGHFVHFERSDQVNKEIMNFIKTE